MLRNELKRVAKLYPNSIAICDLNSDKNITYSELWSLVIHTAANLCDFIGEDQYLGIVADQDTSSIIIILAAAMCHKTIIPIDPRFDIRLITKMINPFTDKLVVSDKLLTRFKNTEFITSPSSTLLGLSDNHNDLIEKEYDSPVYILHTSGTTGKPKAVLANQSSLLHVAKCLGKRYHIDQDSKVLQYSYLSFDSSQIEIWTTLLTGATLIVPGKDLREDMYGCLRNMINHKQINVATLPPSVVMNCEINDLLNLRTLILAGEKCPVTLANKLYNKIPYLINAYGPTEAIICASTYEITNIHKDLVPIGKPLPGMKILLVDSISKNINVSKMGEMYLSSNYLAVEYINDHQLTNDKFQGPNELSTTRYYISGDIGKLLDDGNYEFIGRSDNQVKINGQRVELESIEAEIQQLLNTPKAAVVYINENDLKGLYCILADIKLQSTDAIRTLLIKNLQSYAIPTKFFTIKEIPIDNNGKIDREYIKSFVVHELSTDKTTNSTNESKDLSRLINIWSSVINRNIICEESNFFDLGGDSLSALGLVSKINHEYDIEIGLSDILIQPVTPVNMLSTINKAMVSKGEKYEH